MKNVILYFVFLSLAIWACGEEKQPRKKYDGKKMAQISVEKTKAAKIYKTYCIVCHGADGNLGLNNAKKISESTYSFEERVIQITNGKGLMTSFKDILSDEEIRIVAQYSIDNFKK